MKKVWLIGYFVTMSVVHSVSAQVLTLTVDQAVDMALSQNLNLKRSAIELEEKERKKRTKWNVFLPSMAVSAKFSAADVGGLNLPNTTALSMGDPGTLSVDAGFQLSLPINAGMVDGTRSINAEYRAGLLTYEEASEKLRRDIRKQFWALITNRENYEIQESDLELARKRLEQTQNNYDNGLASELDLLSARVLVSNKEPILEQVKTGYENLLSTFKLLLGVNQDVELELSGDPEPVFYTLNSGDLVAQYISKRLDIRKIDAQIDTLVFGRRAVAWNSKSPSLTLGYTWGINGSNADRQANPSGSPPYSDIDPWTNFIDRGSLSLGLAWKIDGFIPGSKIDVELKNLQGNIDSLRLARQLALESAGVEILNLVNKLETARKSIEAGVSNVELAQRRFELTEEAYRVGTRELLDVEASQQSYLQASQQLLAQKYEYISNILDLEYALNTPVGKVASAAP